MKARCSTSAIVSGTQLQSIVWCRSQYSRISSQERLRSSNCWAVTSIPLGIYIIFSRVIGRGTRNQTRVYRVRTGSSIIELHPQCLGELGRDRTFLAYHKYQSDQFLAGTLCDKLSETAETVFHQLTHCLAPRLGFEPRRLSLEGSAAYPTPGALCLVPKRGLEPPWPFDRLVLNQLCIPFHHSGIVGRGRGIRTPECSFHILPALGELHPHRDSSPHCLVAKDRFELPTSRL